MLWIFINASENMKDVNIQYFTSYSPSNCILVYDPKTKKKCFFVVPFEKGQYKKVKNVAYNDKTFKKEIFKNFNITKISKIGINKKSISAYWVEKLKKDLEIKDSCFKDISSQLSKIRLVKTELEFQKIKKSSYFTTKVFSEIINLLKNKKFNTEKDIYQYILRRSYELNLALAFEPIVASNKNASEPHHIAGDTLLENFVVIDMGYKYKGYCSDITRTIFIEKNRKISEEQEKLWLKVKKMHDYAIEKIKHHIKEDKQLKFKDLDIIIRANLGDKFTHSLGHGVGMEIHEKPFLSSNSEEILSNNIVFTIEPGIYKKKQYGIRHENLFYVKDKKLIKLTNLDENLIRIS